MIIDIVVPFYADSDRIRPALDAILGQQIPDQHQVNLIVVDDGTPDNGASAANLATAYPTVQILRLESNGGRSTACNRGVAAGNGECVMILDSDCVLENEDVLAGHIDLLDRCDASIGSVVPGATGIWGELGNRTAVDRRANAESGRMALLTTQHLVVKRHAFEVVGGFSPAYRHYGFEDRDLLSRLEIAGFTLDYSPNLVAVEYDQPSLSGYVYKARMSGKHSAAIFRLDHPYLYKQTPYYRLDVGLHAWLRPIAALAKAALPLLVRAGDRAITSRVLPVGLRVIVIRFLFAASFMVGTAEAA